MVHSRGAASLKYRGRRRDKSMEKGQTDTRNVFGPSVAAAVVSLLRSKMEV